jgi:hypothetical protein
MRFPLLACLLATTAIEAMARPTAEAIMQALAKRQEVAADGEQIDTQEPAIPELEDPNENNSRMIGDLKQGATTPVGQSIQNILLRTESAEGTKSRYIPPGLLGSNKCKADTCCVWAYVSLAMSLKFTGPTGRCNDLARAAIRLGFHDAGTWSSSLAASGQDFGGADGSIVLSGSEINRAENNGLQAIAKQMATWQKQFGVSMADLIQYGAQTTPSSPAR